MALSEHEQRLLDQLEQQLHAEDPKFANSMATPSGVGISTRRIVIGALVAVAGIALLLRGVSLEMPVSLILGVLGFLVMGSGVYYATTRGRRGAQVSSPARRNEREASSSKNFMSNLENKWDERKREQ